MLTRCVHCGEVPDRLTTSGPMCTQAIFVLNSIGQATRNRKLSYYWNEQRRRSEISREFFVELFPYRESNKPRARR